MRRIAVIPVSQGSLLRTGGCSVLGTELGLGDACAHDARGGCATRDDVAHLVDDLGAAPLLVGDGLDAVLALQPLDELHVGRGAVHAIVLGKVVNAQGVAMEAGQGDELPAIAQLAEVPDERLHLGLGHAGGVPVEGRAQVVGEHLVRPHSLDAVCELRGLLDRWLGRLHPDQVGLRRHGVRPHDAEVRAALDPVEALHGSGALPVEEDVAEAGLGGRVLHALERHLPRVREPLLGVGALGLHGLGNGVGEGHATGALLPVHLSLGHDGLAEGLDTLHGRALDVVVVPGVVVGVHHAGGLGVRPAHDDERGVEDVRLQPRGDEALDLLAGGDQHLAAHVPALLGTRLLVLDVDASRTRLDEHLRQLHDSGESAMAGVGIGDDGVEEVHHRGRGPLLGRPAAALLVLLPVVELLRPEELVHLVRHRVVRVVGHVRPWLVGGRGR
mmetsp:Transcript_35335/g.80257  ORF Transcript_35335/g.80257 Transcript_35335/m.80257 type:complete len:443 (-) Transcript_35335:520-1848(-)